MAGWLDRWAKRAAEAAPADAQITASSPAETSQTPSSRRDFLKKAGIVGGIAWSVPVMQSVMAPAASASVNTPLGGNCNDLAACNGGNSFCNGAICGGPGAVCGATCVSGVSCGSGICGGQNAACTTNAQCAPGKTCNQANNKCNG